MPVEDIKKNGMMAHLVDALDRGEDIGHYGRLVFAMVARNFLTDGEIVGCLRKDRDCDEEKAQALLNAGERAGLQSADATGDSRVDGQAGLPDLSRPGGSRRLQSVSRPRLPGAGVQEHLRLFKTAQARREVRMKSAYSRLCR